MGENDKESHDVLVSPPDSHINQEDGRKYWQGIDADVNGMLGGYPQISNIEMKGSRALLARFGFGANRKGLVKADRVLECGAGIGRLTRGLLLGVAEKVDIVEPIQKFTDALKDTPGVGHVFNCGMEGWNPEPKDQYDIIWNQWCVGHLDDAQFVAFLRKCGAVMTPDTGIVVVKENVCVGKDVFDAQDSSVLRSKEKFNALFEESGLRVVHQQLQRGLPQHLALYPIMMYVLKPGSSSTTSIA